MHTSVDIDLPLEFSAFNLISKNYESTAPLGTKNDTACRIIALRYNFEAVSILLYDGETDRMINRGTFIRDRCLVYSGNDAEFQSPCCF